MRQLHATKMLNTIARVSTSVFLYGRDPGKVSHLGWVVLKTTLILHVPDGCSQATRLCVSLLVSTIRPKAWLDVF